MNQIVMCNIYKRVLLSVNFDDNDLKNKIIGDWNFWKFVGNSFSIKSICKCIY